MSSPAGEDLPQDEAALGRLASTVARTLERMRELEEALETARSRSAELEELLERFREGDEKPAEMKRRLERLEEENGEMRRRIEEGREGVERLLAKIRFLEEQR